MASTAYVGLAVTSHDNTKLAIATFDNVTVNGVTYTNPPPAVAHHLPLDQFHLHGLRQREHQRQRRRAL